MNPEQLLRDFINNFIIPLAPDGLEACTPKQAAKYMFGQQRATLTHNQGINRIQVIVPNQDFTVNHLRGRYLLDPTHFLDGSDFEPIDNTRIREVIQTVIKQVKKLGIPISYTNKIPSHSSLAAAPDQYNIWVCSLQDIKKSVGTIEGLMSLQVYPTFMEAAIALHSELLADGEDHAKGVFLHELMHAFGVPHIPPIQKTNFHQDAATEFLGDPARKADFERLIEVNRCAITDKHRKTIMFQMQRDGYHSKKGEFSIAKVDKIVLQEQYKQMHEPVGGAPKTGRRQELCLNRNATAILSEGMPTYEGRADLGEHSAWRPTGNHTGLRRRHVVKPATAVALKPPVEKSMAEMPDYAELVGNAFNAFGCAFSIGAANYLIQHSRFSDVDRYWLEKGVSLIATIAFYNVPVALFSTGVGMATPVVVDYIKANHPDKVRYIPYLMPLIPIILATLHDAYVKRHLYSALQLAAVMSFELLINMVCGILGTFTAKLTMQGCHAMYLGKIKQA